MATVSAAATAVETISERLAPAFDTLDRTMRQGRRVMVRGQHAAEDAAAATALIIRRRPLSAVIFAAGAASFAAGAIGFGLGWLTRGRK